MSAQHTPGLRPSRTYRNGIGKPVVAKRWDQVIGAHRWEVVFPPCNNFGVWPVAPEAMLVGMAQRWCLSMNSAIAKATGQKGGS